MVSTMKTPDIESGETKDPFEVRGLEFLEIYVSDIYVSDELLTPESPPQSHEYTFVDRHMDPARSIGGDAVLSVRGDAPDLVGDPGAAASTARQRQRGPKDQSLEAHKCLIFTTKPLDEEPENRLTGDCTRPRQIDQVDAPEDAAIIARLTHVHPDGRSIDIANGSSTLTASASPVRIDMGDLGTKISLGHCLRLGMFASNCLRVLRRNQPSDLSEAVRTNPNSSVLQLSIPDDN